MDAVRLLPHVARLFPRRAPRSTRVAVEHELRTTDLRSGGAVPIGRIGEMARSIACARYLGFEPGGQVELSLPCASSPGGLARRLRSDLAALRSVCEARGVILEAEPVDFRTDQQVPLQLTSPRYVAMQRHFDSIGPAGRRMMRRTAATQVCLDWWPGAAGCEQWQVLNLAGPFLAAAFARSSGPQGRLTTWLAVDPARTGFDGRLCHGDDAVAAYAGFAAGAVVFTPPGDPDAHLSTMFPPVRPRGHYLEVRFIDVQETDRVEAVVSILAALLYDDEVRRRCLRALRPERSRLADHWQAAARGELAGLAELGLVAA